MNKKLMALAVAGAIAVPAVAVAQSSTVTIGGAVNFIYYHHDPKNPNVGKKADILDNAESELTIRGEEKLGGGLSAWFQCGSSLDVWGGSVAANDNGLCGRNSGLGFRGNFGNLFFGNWDSPQKLVFNQARGFFSGTNALYGGSANLLLNGNPAGIGNSVGDANSSRFFRRHANSINYWSPSWNGFSVRATVSTGNERTGGVPGTTALNPRMYSLAGEYRTGPLYLGVAYEQHEDYNPGIQAVGAGAAQYSGGTDNNWTLVAAYTFANNLKLSGTYTRNEYDVTNTTSLDVDGFALFLDWAIQGPHIFRAQYIKSNDTGGNSAANVGVYRSPTAVASAQGTGADQWALVYGYAFSKRTEGHIAFNRLSNDGGAAFSMGKVNATLGGNQQSFGIGVRHRF